MNVHADCSVAKPAKETKYLYLLLALIGFVLLLPLQRDMGVEGSRLALSILMTIVLVSGVQAVCHSRGLKILGTSLWIVVFALGIGAGSTEEQSPLWHGMEIAGDMIAIFALIALIIFILQDVFIGEITRDRLRGAGAAYLLMGIAFGFIFRLIDTAFPDSFRWGSEGPIAALDANFFSFVTLTTLGYGDITPARPFAQAAAYMESSVGQFYLTVLVAFLVGKRLASLQQGSTA